MRVMKAYQGALLLLFWLVLAFLLLSSLLLLRPSGEEESGPSLSGLEGVPRRMLASMEMTYSAGHKPGVQAVEEAWKALKTSLRRAPRSGSNPTQNKHPMHS
ncbi:hypothetical protein SAY87_016181 [Trapa incisa]|uniref:Uncharacterized protein n=1 Tax=Trapa incisa TaxID=236973 RepID=A0AAN7L833_9MYRT|nr:hypothetical protein SAY87_016181 [Trapa incisa]